MRKMMFIGVLMTAALGGCNKDKKKAAQNGGGDKAPPAAAALPANKDAASAGGGSTGGIIPGGGGGVVLNPTQALGGGGGGGAAGAVRKAVDRTKIRAALQDMRLLLSDYSLASGKMPPPNETYAMVKKGAPKYAKMIEDGDIVIHAARTREDVWAYEAKAPFGKHMVLTSQGIEDLDTDALKQRLGMR